MTTAALERASIVEWLGAGRSLQTKTDSQPVLGHLKDVQRGLVPTWVRDRLTMLSLQADLRTYLVADVIARRTFTVLVQDKVWASDRTRDLCRRHPDATVFLLMNDFAGLIRPLVDALEAAKPDKPKLPVVEGLARRALAEIGAFEFPAASPSLPAIRTNGLRSAHAFHVADGQRTAPPAPGIEFDLMLEAQPEPLVHLQPFRLLRMFKLLRAASVPPALAVLLSRALLRIVSGRLERLATFNDLPHERSTAPAIYWSNVSLRSVFHASERRARGLPTIAVYRIITSASPRYRCDVFDAVITVGTGQRIGAADPFRLPEPPYPMRVSRQSRHVLVALQPSLDILSGLAAFARLTLRHGWQLSVRPHPSMEDGSAGLWQWERDLGQTSTVVDIEPDASPSVVVTGLSTFATQACLAGLPVVLLCSAAELAATWGSAPPPGLVVDPTSLAGISAADAPTRLETLVVEARHASSQFADYYRSLPLFDLSMAG